MTTITLPRVNSMHSKFTTRNRFMYSYVGLKYLIECEHPVRILAKLLHCNPCIIVHANVQSLLHIHVHVRTMGAKHGTGVIVGSQSWQSMFLTQIARAVIKQNSSGATALNSCSIFSIVRNWKAKHLAATIVIRTTTSWNCGHKRAQRVIANIQCTQDTSNYMYMYIL